MGTTIAETLGRRAAEAVRKAQDEQARHEADKAAEDAVFRSRIFERAQRTYDNCLALAGEAADKGLHRKDVELYSGRFDKRDFADRVNEWQMVVIALRENGLTAEYVVREYLEYHELGGGDEVVHTPYIEMTWPEKA